MSSWKVGGCTFGVVANFVQDRIENPAGGGWIHVLLSAPSPVLPARCWLPAYLRCDAQCTAQEIFSSLPRAVASTAQQRRRPPGNETSPLLADAKAATSPSWRAVYVAGTSGRQRAHEGLLGGQAQGSQEMTIRGDEP